MNNSLGNILKPDWRHVLEKKRTVIVKLLIITAFAALLLLQPAGQLFGNGDTVEIYRGRQGSYEIIVGILPGEPRLGTVHFSITPLDFATLLPVADAEIIIVAKDQQGMPIYQARALNTPEFPQYYDANITFESAGFWTMVVDVSEDELGEATVQIALAVEVQSIGAGKYGGLVFLIVFLVLIGGALYVWYSSRRLRRKTDS